MGYGVFCAGEARTKHPTLPGFLKNYHDSLAVLNGGFLSLL